MVKKIFLFIILFFLFFAVYADDLYPDQGFRFKNRTVEFGFNAAAGFSNNVFSVSDFMKEKILLDLDAIDSGLKINTNIGVTPFYFRFNRNNKWGFSLSINGEVFGNVNLSENLSSLSEADNEKSDAGFSAFSDISLDVFFHVKDFKIKIKPSVFYTVAYSRPDITYTFNTSGTPVLTLDYDARVYTAIKIDNIDNINLNINSLSAAPGADISFGIEYPFSRATGLYKTFALFDFDIGVDVLHIPVMASTMRHYMRITGNTSMEGDTIEDFFKSIDTDNFFSEPEYGENKIFVKRPFRTNLYVNWRPLGSRFFTIIPNIGFSINPLYLDPFSMEYGFKAKMDLANIFVLTAGANYEDRVWKNRADIVLNFRVLEFNIGAELKTNNFLRMKNTSGLGVYTGLKLGF